MKTSEEITATASLRIGSKTLLAKDMENVLGASATRSFDKGELASPRNPKSVVRDESLLIFEAGLPETASIEEHLEKLADFVDQHISQLQQLAKHSSFDYSCAIFISGTNGQAGIALPSALMVRLLKIPAAFIFSIYYPSADELLKQSSTPA